MLLLAFEAVLRLKFKTPLLASELFQFAPTYNTSGKVSNIALIIVLTIDLLCYFVRGMIFPLTNPLLGLFI